MQALSQHARVALCLFDQICQMLVHGLLLAGIHHRFVLVVDHSLSFCPEFHDLQPSWTSACLNDDLGQSIQTLNGFPFLAALDGRQAV